ncbi:hypothetical protein OAP63_18430 [Vibrio sp.]|nr:hypothetical protein [Vibrio sp.]
MALLCLVGLVGCDDSLERWLNKETYSFQGTYDNQYNDDKLVFTDGEVTITSVSKSWVVPFKVDGNSLVVQVKNSSKEKRPDIEMRIHGDGEVLTCSVCGMYRLSNVWVKVNYEPKMSESK